MRRLCLFAHFDVAPVIADHVVAHVRAIHEQLGAEIVFTSTVPTLPDSETQKVTPWTTRVNCRENQGYDFGSHWFGMQQLVQEGASWRDYGQVFLINDSVYGPFYELGPIVDRMHAYDVWSMTDNLEHAYHMQSYWFCVNPAAYDFLGRFFETYTFPSDVMDVVAQGEFGFTRQAQDAGLRIGAACSVTQLPWWRRFGGPKNPNFYHWKWLVRSQGCPYVKVGLLKKPHRAKGFGAVLQGRYDINMIRESLV